MMKVDLQIGNRVKNLKSAEGLLKRLQAEVKLARSLQKIKTLRHAGRFGGSQQGQPPDISSLYDWTVDIDLLSKISREGWKVTFSQDFMDKGNREPDGSWQGAIVAVVGLYDKGKTFVLNNLSDSNLPSGKKVTTKGLSFKYVDVDQGTKMVLLDTAGSYAPVKV